MRRRKAATVASAVLAAGLLASLSSIPSTAYAQDAGEATLVPLQITGPPGERLNLVILGDGYTAGEMDTFRADVDRNQNVMWSVEPFRSYRDYFNVYALEIVSGVSGISCDPDNGNVRRDTPLHLEFADECPADPLARGITYRRPDGHQARTRYLETYVAPALGIPADAQNLQTLALANTFTYGGIGGRHATTSGGSPQGPLISLHEVGHSLGNLQDEYPYRSRPTPGGPWCDPGESDPSDRDFCREPESVHHTRMTSQQMVENEAKWWRWLGEESTSGGVIRAADPDGYESGMYASSQVWRPSEHSMMRWLGYYLDQVGREQMTGRITGLRDAGAMPLPATPGDEVGPEDVVWVKTMHPTYHELDVSWGVNGQPVPGNRGSRNLDLAELDTEPGDTVAVTVRDPTGFVRDPALRSGPRMTRTREWTVGEPLPEEPVDVAFTASTQTDEPVGGQEVVYVETTHPTDRVLTVTWSLDGEVIPGTRNRRTFDLAKQNLPAGTYALSATVADPADPGGSSQTLTWTVDNVLPTAPRTLSEPLATLAGGLEHNVYFDEFDMSLQPRDNTDGFVVGEFRLDGDGWYNYFGFPEEPLGTPWTFSHSGIDIKALNYGSLGSPGGVAKAAFEQHYGPDDPGRPFVPGFGTHTVEHRAIDAAGNIGEADEFRATVLPGAPPECTVTVSGRHRGRLVVTEGVTCLDGAQVNGGVTVRPGGSLVASASTLGGGLVTREADTVQLFGTTVHGRTRIAGTTADVTTAGSTFDGPLTLSGNHQVNVNERFREFGYEYGPIMVGNTVHGRLACSGNSADVTDFGGRNTIRGPATDQCARL